MYRPDRGTAEQLSQPWRTCTNCIPIPEMPWCERLRITSSSRARFLSTVAIQGALRTSAAIWHEVRSRPPANHAPSRQQPDKCHIPGPIGPRRWESCVESPLLPLRRLPPRRQATTAGVRSASLDSCRSSVTRKSQRQMTAVQEVQKEVADPGGNERGCLSRDRSQWRLNWQWQLTTHTNPAPTRAAELRRERPCVTLQIRRTRLKRPRRDHRLGARTRHPARRE